MTFANISDQPVTRTETPLMRHWRKVNEILAAAGVPEANFGEVRHVSHYAPMKAAFMIWSDRYE